MASSWNTGIIPFQKIFQLFAPTHLRTNLHMHTLAFWAPWLPSIHQSPLDIRTRKTGGALWQDWRYPPPEPRLQPPGHNGQAQNVQPRRTWPQNRRDSSGSPLQGTKWLEALCRMSLIPPPFQGSTDRRRASSATLGKYRKFVASRQFQAVNSLSIKHFWLSFCFKNGGIQAKMGAKLC